MIWYWSDIIGFSFEYVNTFRDQSLIFSIDFEHLKTYIRSRSVVFYKKTFSKIS